MRPLQFLVVAAVLAIGISAPIPVAHAQDRVVPSERVKYFVYIRENASSQSREIGRLKPNESVEFFRNVPRWREVRLPDVVSRGDFFVFLQALTNPDKILISVENATGPTPAEISICNDKMRVFLDEFDFQADSVIAECTSPINSTFFVNAGPVEVVLNGDDGRTGIVSPLIQNDQIVFDHVNFEVDNIGNSQFNVTVNGIVTVANQGELRF